MVLAQFPFPASADTYSLTSFDAPNAFYTIGIGITDSGEIVGNFRTPDSYSAAFIRNTAKQFKTFQVQVSGCDGIYISAANHVGDVCGSCLNYFSFIRFHDGRLEIFEIPQNTELGSVNLASINDQGDVTGNYTAALAEHGFIRNHSGAVTLIDIPGAVDTDLHAINNKGEVIGYSYTPLSGYLPFFRRADETFVSLDPRISSIKAINDKGQITGYTLDSFTNESAATSFSSMSPQHYRLVR